LLHPIELLSTASTLGRTRRAGGGGGWHDGAFVSPAVWHDLVRAFCRRGGDDGAKTPMRVYNWLNMYKYHARVPLIRPKCLIMAQLVCCGVMQHVFIDPLKRSSPKSLQRMFARLGCDHHEADDIDVNMDEDDPPLQIVPNLSSMLQSSEHLAEQIDRAAGTLRSLQHCFSEFGDRLAAEGAIRTLDDITLNFSAHGYQLATPYHKK
jgi:hypothetical protein